MYKYRYFLRLVAATHSKHLRRREASFWDVSATSKVVTLLGLFASFGKRTIREFFGLFKDCQPRTTRGEAWPSPIPSKTSRFLKPLTDTMISVKQQLCGGNQTFVISQNPQTQVPGLKIVDLSLMFFLSRWWILIGFVFLNWANFFMTSRFNENPFATSIRLWVLSFQTVARGHVFLNLIRGYW